MRRTRLLTGLVLLAGLLVATRFARVDYAEWATRPNVVFADDSPAAAAAERYVEARTAWVACPSPETWKGLWALVVPEKRGQPGGDWPWGPPALSLQPFPGEPPRGTPLAVGQLRSWVRRVWPPDEEARVTACFVDVSFILTVNPGTAEARSYPARMEVRLRFVDSERKWLVDPGP